jgi:hypothetical protein
MDENNPQHSEDAVDAVTTPIHQPVVDEVGVIVVSTTRSKDAKTTLKLSVGTVLVQISVGFSPVQPDAFRETFWWARTFSSQPAQQLVDMGRGHPYTIDSCRWSSPEPEPL